MTSENQPAPVTIEDLDQEGVPASDWSPTLLRLRTKPIDQLTHEEIRLAIVNKWALSSLIPLALNILENAPATGYGIGVMTLLEAVLGVTPSFWASHPDWWARARTSLGREVDAYVKLPPAEFSALAGAQMAERWKQLASRYLTNVAADGRDKVIRLD
jgi:hypothetical protein